MHNVWNQRVDYFYPGKIKKNLFTSKKARLSFYDWHSLWRKTGYLLELTGWNNGTSVSHFQAHVSHLHTKLCVWTCFLPVFTLISPYSSSMYYQGSHLHIYYIHQWAETWTSHTPLFSEQDSTFRKSKNKKTWNVRDLVEFLYIWFFIFNFCIIFYQKLIITFYKWMQNRSLDIPYGKIYFKKKNYRSDRTFFIFLDTKSSLSKNCLSLINETCIHRYFSNSKIAWQLRTLKLFRCLVLNLHLCNVISCFIRNRHLWEENLNHLRLHISERHVLKETCTTSYCTPHFSTDTCFARPAGLYYPEISGVRSPVMTLSWR
jgi:hypothetical protein